MKSTIHLFDFADIGAIHDLNFVNYTLLMSLGRNDLSMKALSVLQLVENNPSVKKLCILENTDISNIRGQMFRYLGQCCPEVKEVVLRFVSIKAVHLAMTAFPELRKIELMEMKSYLMQLPDAPAIYPKIESFKLNPSTNEEFSMISKLIKACPNLKTLCCHGACAHADLREILSSCKQLTSLSVSVVDDEVLDEELVLTMSAIANNCLQLTELTMIMEGFEIDVTMFATRHDMVKIIKRLQKLNLNIYGFLDDIEDPDNGLSVYSLFSSPDIDLKSLSTNTRHARSNSIAMLLKSCRYADTLSLKGDECIVSEVMMLVTGSCRQLVDLSLNYDGQITGAAMRQLLQSCDQLMTLKLQCVAMDVEAYESLVLYGTNIINLILVCPDMPQTVVCQPFKMNSPLRDNSFKQHRKKPMYHLKYAMFDLDLESLARFLSFFGTTDHISVRLHPNIVREEFDAMENGIPIYHAREVFVSSPLYKLSGLDAALISMMNACRSLRALHIISNYTYPSDCFVDASSLMLCACLCRVQNPLEIFACPGTVDLSYLKKLLPKLKLKNVAYRSI
jgi:hypothetical protein